MNRTHRETQATTLNGWRRTSFLVVLAVSSCNTSVDRPLGIGDMDAEIEDGAAPDAGEARCAPGDLRSCKVSLPSHNGVNACFVGVSVCARGTWSACMSREDAEKVHQDDAPDAAVSDSG